MNPNYDKFPTIRIPGYENDCWTGWEAITQKIRSAIAEKGKAKILLVCELYPGADEAAIRAALRQGLSPDCSFDPQDAMKDEAEIDRLTFPDVTDDRVFGRMTGLQLEDFFDPHKLHALRQEVEAARGVVLICGTGASLLTEHPDLLIYADMARWEIQLRMRKQEVANLGARNYALDFIQKYKRAYFVDWRVADHLKKALLEQWDFVLDTNNRQQPKMASGTAVRAGLRTTAQRPFRVVPFFDPGPWGGQWMKEVCDLDRSAPNFAWCFDCVPEENSLLLDFGPVTLELPAIDLVFHQPENLLGQRVFERFGAEFPIRFDFLDTMGGGNLSLQVHPGIHYIREHFGMRYTQDESYYLLDAGDDAVVYLGLKENISPPEMIDALARAQETGTFDADGFVEKWAVKKHDHVLIPAGTVHCSGKNSMVLEISATPYIFTFKLWDWGRLGLDGLPRPIHLEHGKRNIDWSRTTGWVRQNLINRLEPLDHGEGWREERTGLHETEFIETRRHWFTQTVRHDTCGNLNVLNLVEGREAVVESPSSAFEPFIVHYAETFIVPAAAGAYTIRPHGESAGKTCATVKAFVRDH